MPAGSKTMLSNCTIKLSGDIPQSLIDFLEKSEIGDRYRFPKDLLQDEICYREKPVMLAYNGDECMGEGDGWFDMLRIRDGFLIYTGEGACIAEDPYCFCPEMPESRSISRMASYNDMSTLRQINTRYCEATLYDWTFGDYLFKAGYWSNFLGCPPDDGDFDSKEAFEFARFMCGEQDYYTSETLLCPYGWLNLYGYTSQDNSRDSEEYDYFMDGVRGMFRKDGKIYAIGVDLNLVELQGGPYNFYLERIIDFYKYMKNACNN